MYCALSIIHKRFLFMFDKYGEINKQPFSSKEIKKFSIDFPQINVAVRNFILSADDLRRKLKVKDGGDKRVFGCTIVDGSRQLIVVSKV